MFCDQEYDISWRTSMCFWLERSVYSAAIWWKILCMSTWSKLFKTIISILLFYLVGLSMVQCEVLKFPVLHCCLFLLSSVKICLIYLAPFDVQFSSVQFSHSVVSDSATPWIAACQASLSITNSWSLLQPMSIESVMPSSHLILCRPLLLLSPIPPSIRVFSSESTLHMRWPKFWSFSFSISPLMLGSCIFTIVISSWWVDPFIIIELSSFSPVTFFDLKSFFLI